MSTSRYGALGQPTDDRQAGEVPETTTTQCTVLIATGDPALAAAMHRWAAAAGANSITGTDIASIRRAWRSSSVVALGSDLVSAVAQSALPRRDRVLMFATTDVDEHWPDAVAIGAEAVIDAHDEQATLNALTSAIDGSAEACLLSVVGGSGGVGASTLAAALAIEAGRLDAKSLLIDADPFGGGADLLLGAEHHDGLRWSDLADARGHIAAATIADSLPTRHGCSVLSFGRTAQVGERLWNAGPLVQATSRAFDVITADIGRTALEQPGPLTAELLGSSVLVIVVVRDDIRGLAAAARVHDSVAALASSLALVVQHTPGGHGGHEVERSLGSPVLAEISHDRSLARAIDFGDGPAGSRKLKRACRRILENVGVR